MGGYTAANSITVELDARTWQSGETAMWLSVVEKLSNITNTGRPSLIVLQEAAAKALARACLKEVLVLVRNVPSRAELRMSDSTAGQASDAYEAVSGGNAAQSCIRCVAHLVVECQRQWDEQAAVLPATDLGRLAVVLAGDGIGNSLRAGTKKFH